MKKTILALLMDVAPLTRATIGRAFNPADFEVLWAANVSETMQLSTRHHVDLLLLDLNQPLPTGRGIFGRLTSLNRGAPVVILTEHKAEHEETVADQAGAVLQKPFSVAALVHTINTLLGKPLSGAAPLSNQDVGIRDVTPKSDEFREMLYQRHTTPYVVATPHRHWGINE